MLGLAIACTWKLLINGLEGILQIILAVGIAMLLLYPIYLLKGLGAGDVKLFCVIACFLTREELVKTIITSLIIASIMGIFIIWKKKRWKEFLIEIKERKKITYTEIHFSISILISILPQIGGFY